MAMEDYNSGEPLNIGTGKEISIFDLVYKIADLTGFRGKIEWDSSKPDGQPRRKLDVSKAKEQIGFEAEVDLDEGLKRTIEWYKNAPK